MGNRLMELAPTLCAVAAWILPARRKSWGKAMQHELAFIDSDRDAVAFGAECIAAAVHERMLDFDTRFAAGLWAAALVGMSFAGFYLSCAVQGVGVLRGAPDGFLNTLLSTGGADAQLVARYMLARPIVITCLFALGLTHLAAAWFLSRRQIRRFLFAWALALAIAAVAVAIQLSVVWTPGGLPTEFVAVVAQALIVGWLLLWSNGRHVKGKTS